MAGPPAAVSSMMAVLGKLRAHREAVARDAEVRLAALDEDIAVMQRAVAIMSRNEQDEPSDTQTEGEPPMLTPPISEEQDETADTTGTQESLPFIEPPKAAAPLPLTMSQWAQKLRGKTQADALPIIARENGGILRVREAKQIFIATGLAKGQPKYISPHIYHMLEDMEEFEKEGIGTFRLRQKPYLTAV